MLTLDDTWIWDFWFADDGIRFHLFFLHAPTSLGDEHRRHRAARIGHAVSEDLTEWTVLPGDVFDAGPAGSFDSSATWTGNVVQTESAWWMFYTGSRFLHPEPAIANIETIGVAVSADLTSWVKRPGPIARADARWYETWGTSTWREEAWRDPWVFPDPGGDGWHMLITARAGHGPIDDRGVIGHAVSADLEHWETRPPLTEPGAGFAQLEVSQAVQVDGTWLILFSSGTDTMSEPLRTRYPRAATWVVTVDDPTQPFDLIAARPLLTDELYSGRLVQDRDGRWVVLGFRTYDERGEFLGGISDPLLVGFDADRRLTLADQSTD